MRVYGTVALLAILTLAILLATRYGVLSAADSGSPGRSKNAGRMAMSTVSVCVIDANGELTAPVLLPKVIRTDAEWRQRLTVVIVTLLVLRSLPALR